MLNQLRQDRYDIMEILLPDETAMTAEFTLEYPNILFCSVEYVLVAV
jgi:hypothetical protein